MLLNLEDLWLETRPQNVPGTGADCPNWRRRAQPALEQLGALPAAAELLALLARAGGLGRPGSGAAERPGAQPGPGRAAGGGSG
ncbi:MAG: hypothetical protein KatS3mg102_0358 [Planctomycetota bacterium]|nr:MAG: hypothetical protein KatS3mg102_0358 [Planctomycetota bacterium]